MYGNMTIIMKKLGWYDWIVLIRKLFYFSYKTSSSSNHIKSSPERLKNWQNPISIMKYCKDYMEGGISKLFCSLNHPSVDIASPIEERD